MDDPRPSHLADVRARIAAAAARRRPRPRRVTLIAVSKQQPWEAIAPVLAEGQRVFGENRVQEAMARWADRRAEHRAAPDRPAADQQGRRRRRPFRRDRDARPRRLASALAGEIARQGRAPRLYVQVNTGEEAQKAGVAPREADAFIAACRERHGLTIEGLMCIPPADEPPGPHFALLAEIAARNGLADLSMGMSGDFETAIRFGATTCASARRCSASAAGRASSLESSSRESPGPGHGEHVQQVGDAPGRHSPRSARSRGARSGGRSPSLAPASGGSSL